MNGMWQFILSFVLRPIWVNDLKNKTENITEDEGVIYTEIQKF